MVPKISFLIVTWNSWNDLERCLESVCKATFKDFEIVVIDNGSIDGTVEKVGKKFPEVNLRVNETNIGLPPAVNQGFCAAQGKYIMLLDVDTEIAPDTPACLYDFMEKRPDVSMVAPRIFTPEGDVEQSARNLPSIMTGLFGRQSFLRRVFPNNPFSRRYLVPENLDKTEPFQVEQVSAACMFMRRSLIDEAGPWDEGYRCYWIDSDWCARLRQRGNSIYCVPKGRIVHHENNRTGRKKSPWRILHFHLGAYRLYRKYYTRGFWDLRALFAAVALTCRAGYLLVLNTFITETSAKSD